MKMYLSCFAFISIIFLVSSVQMSGLVGGLQEQSLSILDEDVAGTGHTLNYYLKKGVIEYNKMLNSMYFYAMNNKDMDIKTQVVQGVLYIVTGEMVPTECNKNDMLEVGSYINTIYHILPIVYSPIPKFTLQIVAHKLMRSF